MILLSRRFSTRNGLFVVNENEMLTKFLSSTEMIQRLHRQPRQLTNLYLPKLAKVSSLLYLADNSCGAERDPESRKYLLHVDYSSIIHSQSHCTKSLPFGFSPCSTLSSTKLCPLHNKSRLRNDVQSDQAWSHVSIWPHRFYLHSLENRYDLCRHRSTRFAWISHVFVELHALPP